MALDATLAGASANSLVTLAEFKTYLGDRLYASDVLAMADLDLEKLLKMSCSRIEEENFLGRKAAGLANGAGQRLKWPRSGITDEDGYWLTATYIPRSVKEAQMDLAIIIGQKGANYFSPDSALSPELAQFSELTLPGGLKMKMREVLDLTTLPENVLRKLAPYLASGPGTIRLVRA